MTKTTSTLLITTSIIALVLLTAFVTANQIIKNKTIAFLKDRVPNHITVKYENLDVETFSGTIIIAAPQVTIANQNDTVKHTIVTAKKLVVEDVSYLDYIFKNQITIEDIKLKQASVIYYKDKYLKVKDTARAAPIQLYKPILIEELSIDNTEIQIFDNTKDSLFLKASDVTLEIDDVFLSSSTLSRKLPLDFSDYDANGEDIFLKTGPYENLEVGSFKIEKGLAAIDSISLKTKYSRDALSRIITKERDYFDLTIPRLSIDGFSFGFKDDRLFTQSNMITLDDPYLDIFRDKLVRDDLSIKSLYSKMLRDLKIALTVEELKINNGGITYSEKVKNDNNGGTINFSNIDGKIMNVSNTYTSPTQTEISINALFMETAPFKVDWSFDTTHTNDAFLFKAYIGQIPSDKLNPFTKPNLNIALEGEVNQTYFTISGDNNTSQIDMRMKYEDFKVNIMRKDKSGVNKLLSGIANLFIKKDSNSEDGIYNEGSGEATRDKTKSFFNYLWLNLRSGLLKTLSRSYYRYFISSIPHLLARLNKRLLHLPVIIYPLQ